MKNVKLLVTRNGYGQFNVELWVDLVMVKSFQFGSHKEATAFYEGFRACESRFCRLDMV
jgi:hypothetical protein